MDSQEEVSICRIAIDQTFDIGSCYVYAMHRYYLYSDVVGVVYTFGREPCPMAMISLLGKYSRFVGKIRQCLHGGRQKCNR